MVKKEKEKKEKELSIENCSKFKRKLFLGEPMNRRTPFQIVKKKKNFIEKVYFTTLAGPEATIWVNTISND
jgi:hypothetical protein